MELQDTVAPRRRPSCHAWHWYPQRVLENGAKAVLPLSAFTTQTASRLTTLSVRQLHYWDKKNFFSPSFVDPNTRRPHSRLYSFRDIVGLRAIAKLRQQGVSLQELRKVRAFFESETPEEEWANRQFFSVGDRVFFTHRDAVVASKPLGQRVEPSIMDLGQIVADVQALIQRLQIRSGEEFGRVTSDRFIMGGTPVIAGTRIPTATISWFRRNGYSFDQILEEFPRLTREDIAAALTAEDGQACEHSQRLAG